MDRALWRGKVNKYHNFIIGYYKQDKQGRHIITDVRSKLEFFVNPNSLCQCTTKKDEEGNLTFEGDMFWHNIEDGMIGIIQWNEEELMWDVRIVPNIVDGGFAPELDNTLEWWKLEEYDKVPRIVGNIHDTK